MRGRGWLLYSCLALAACAGAPPRAPLPVGATAQRQVLVTVRMAPPHFRADAAYGGDYQSAPGRAARRRIARALARDYRLQLLDEWPIPTLKVDCFVLQATGPVDARLLQRLSADPRVVSAQPMHLYRALGARDPLAALPMAWHLGPLQARATGRHVTVAEVDSGVELSHPDLRGQIAVARNFVDDGGYRAEAHGTEVAGIIVAHATDGAGVAGIAPGARLLALRACRQETPAGATCSSLTLARALQFALQVHAQVINMSLAGPDDALLAQLLDAALEQRISVVAAVDPGLAGGGFPADHPGVLAVAGDGDGSRVAGVLRAPWRDIPTTEPGAGWGFVSGSSFAAAQVSGLAAVLRELSPRLPPARLRAALRRIDLQRKAPTLPPAGSTRNLSTPP
jgi:hypothetical protein